MKKVGIDIGSTTIKIVVIENNNIIYKNYQRHYSHILEKLLDVLNETNNNIIKDELVYLAISGSAGMGISEEYDI